MARTKKRNLLIVLLSIFSVIAFAQDNYYYYKGQRIPLTINPKVVNLINFYDGSQFSPSILQNNLPSNLEIEEIIHDNVKSLCIIKDVSENPRNLEQLIDSSIIIRPDIIIPSYNDEFENPLIPSGNIFVKLKNANDYSLLRLKLLQYKLNYSHQNLFMPLWHIISVTPDTPFDVVKIANILYESGSFQVVEPDFMYKNILNSISWDEKVNQQWGLYNASNPITDINVSSAWNYATGKGVKIGIFDTGIDHTHQDLKDNINNLLYDTETNSNIEVVYENHGTHVAGIAASIRNNGIFGAGVAPDAQLVPISSMLSRYSILETEKLANGFNWAVVNNIEIVNCSWHWTKSEIIADAIDNAIDDGRNGKGCIIVKSAGNSNSTIGFFGNYRSEIVTVGAINLYGIKTDFSCFGEDLDIVAPGDSILSTLPTDSIGYLSGTSMAAPHVAGIAALILELNPDLTGQQVRDIIEQSTIKVGDVEYTDTVNRPNGTWNKYYGYGLVDALKAVKNTPRKQIEY